MSEITTKAQAEAAVTAANKKHEAAAGKATDAREKWLGLQRDERYAFHTLRQAQVHPLLVDIEAEIASMIGGQQAPAPVAPPIPAPAPRRSRAAAAPQPEAPAPSPVAPEPAPASAPSPVYAPDGSPFEPPVAAPASPYAPPF